MIEKTRVPAVWAATAGYAVTGALELFHEQASPFASPTDYLIEAGFAVGLAGSAAASFAFLGSKGRSRAVTAGWLLAALGNAALLVSATATAVTGRDALGPAFMLGMLGAVAGYVTLTVTDVRGTLVPARAGVALLVGFVGSIVLAAVTAALLSNGGGGTLALAASWAAVARLTAEPQGRVRTA